MGKTAHGKVFTARNKKSEEQVSVKVFTKDTLSQKDLIELET